ncbi:RHS repeat-associated core domain-containing protein [Streptomyces xylophagus]|uniref:RHS repeat-associated core domain-containing protein n=1 Tax=Streptomyces xylophagus TaxID=285514 RepID=UPI000A900141|nr:RHS repeat-associated core domain-containing protein [Streptomyces xylophagus]
MSTQKARTPSAAKPRPATTGPLSAPDAASAFATARLRKRKVEILDQLTDKTTTWANPNGSLTTRSYAAPIRFKRAGKWVDVDTTLHMNADGAVTPKAQPNGLVLAPGGKNAVLAGMGSGKHRVAVGWKGTLPKPSLKGTTATYANVTPGADVTVEATRTGFEENVILKSRPKAGYTVTIPVSAKGLTAKQLKNGSITFTDAHHKVVGTIPAPMMWDAQVDVRSLEHPNRARLKMTMSQSGDTVNLTLTPDAKFLADPNTQYPVTVDPSTSLSPLLDTWVENTDTAPEYTSTDLKLGTYDSGTDVARSFLEFPVLLLDNTQILSSSLNLYEYWAGGCVQSPWELWESGESSTDTVWSNQPVWKAKYATTSQTKGYSSDCTTSSAEGWVSIDPSTFLQYAGDNGYDVAYLGLRASDETDSNSWKRFYSANASANVPYLSATYNSYPMPSAPTVAPGVSSVSGSTTTLYTNTTTPQLQSTVTDADGGNVMAQWNVYDTTGGASTKVISNLNGSWTASGGISSASVAAGTLVNGHTYTAWPYGYDGSLWSRQTVPNGLVFTIDTTKPGAPTVASTDYPSGGWAKGAGQSGAFTITPPSGGTDTSGVVWQLDSGAQNSVATSGGAVSVGVTPAADGPHTLTVATRDNAGNLSASTVYSFNAGNGAVTSPTDGTRTARRVTLTAAAAASTWQSVKFQYRRSATDSWTTIPVADVTSGGNAVSSWPVAVTSGANSPLVWDVSSTLGDDGSVQVRAEFTDTSSASHDTSAVTATLDRAATQTATAAVGPGTLNLSTGNYTLSGPATSVLGMSVGQTLDSRTPQATPPAGQTAPFGPGWQLAGASATALTDFTEIRPVTSTAVQLVGAAGTQVSFTKTSSGSWTPEPGAEAYTLSYSSSADTYTLTDTSGTTTVFAKSATTAGVWAVASTSPPGSGTSVRYRFDSVTSGSTTTMRLARMAAPVSAISDTNASCLTPTTPAVGCRVLQLSYATATTATGTTSGTFGDYTGQVSMISMWATDPATGTETSKVVAQYAYDSTGALRQEWNPQITPSLVTAYTYTSAGRVATLTPPGQLPWTFTYGTAGTNGDTNAGRLLSVSRPTLTPGSASTTNGTATTTVVYDVPRTTAAGGPYAMGASDVASLAQADAPTDATAIFPADQVPTSNTGSGNLTSSSYTRADIHYLDVNGRESNTATPGGHITTVDYDALGNAARQLSAANRELALAASTNTELNVLGLAAMTTAQRANLLSTVNVRDSSGQLLTDMYGPLHQVTLEHALAASGTSAARAAGSVVAARTHIHNTYDEGRPTDGSANASGLVTTAVTGSTIAGYATDADTRTTKTVYDWTLGQATRTTVDPAGLAITTATGYNSAGKVISNSQPSSTGSDAGATTTTYYTATGSSPCGGHPEWADLVCQTAPAGAITGGGSNPSQRTTTTTTYNLYGSPSTVTQTANSVTRISTTTYDAAGRKSTVAVSGGVGQAVQTTTTAYNASNGQQSKVSTPDGASNTWSYDQLGRGMSSTDADGNTVAVQYDALDRPTQTTDTAPSTTTYTYDTSKDPRGVPTTQTDSNAGAFGATYDADGNLTTESLPGSITLKTTTDETGQATSRVYTDANGNVLLSDQAGYSGAGLEVSRAQSTTGGLGVNNTYAYDAASRLSDVSQTVLTTSATTGATSTCTTRHYAFDKDSNRTGLTTAVGAAKAACPTSGGTTVSHSYDSADRLVDSGYTYDAFGRTTAEPSGTTTAYYANDLAYQQTSGTSRVTWQLDPAGRIRSSTSETNTSGSWTQSAARTNHYDGTSDSPAWIRESTSAYTRNINDMAGDLSAIYSSATGHFQLQLTNLHGDINMVLPVNDSTTPVLVMAADEYGNPLTGTSTSRYGWLGGKQRSSETPTGDILMGARLYAPTTGRFLSTDPVFGGSANAYDYVGQDPVNALDLNGLFKIYKSKPYISVVLNKADQRAIAQGAVWGIAGGVASKTGLLGAIIAGIVAGVLSSYIGDNWSPRQKVFIFKYGTHRKWGVSWPYIFLVYYGYW